jgi:SAM-dependent methyltransferase
LGEGEKVVNEKEDTLWWEELYPSLFHFWWEKGYYHQIHVPDAEREIDLILQMVHLPARGRVLDLGCGMGRHVLELARRGYRTMGVDRSPLMLKVAREGIAREQLEERSTVLQGDMRSFQPQVRFDLVLMMDCCFGIFEQKGNREVLETVRRSLRPGGWVFLETMNPFFWASEKRGLRQHFFREGEGTLRCFDYDLLRGRLEDQITFVDLTQKRCHSFPVQSLRLYTPAEINQMLGQCGFETPSVATSDLFDIPTAPRLYNLSRASLLYTAARLASKEGD